MWMWYGCVYVWDMRSIQHLQKRVSILSMQKCACTTVVRISDSGTPSGTPLMYLSGELIFVSVVPIVQHVAACLSCLVISCQATQFFVVEQTAQQTDADLDGGSSGFHVLIVSDPAPFKQVGFVVQGLFGKGGETDRSGNIIPPDACSLSPVALRKRLKFGEVRLRPKHSEPHPTHSGRFSHPVGITTQDSTVHR